MVSSAVEKIHDEQIMPILRAQGVSVDYSRRGVRMKALDDVSLDVRPGETVGLIGESGSGKTTLSRVLLGLLRPRSGTVLFQGTDIYQIRNDARHRFLGGVTSMVFQDPRSSLNSRLSVSAVIADPLRVQRIGDRDSQRETVRNLLESVGLSPSIGSRPVRSLSGGQLQRVAVARALAVKPSVIVADEPTSALDVSVQAQILNLLRSLKESADLSFLLISHDMRAIRFLADRTAVMYGGTIVEEGDTTQVCEEPNHDYTRSLLAAAPSMF
ncbi:peptide/nickel transport system ATP-binding protein [Prauserella marina]|uniref:Peptide/nickel transport system ATP-binding protein n=1 Tax=Prauserella marina TaxID=530584 RepID=A0A1G6ULL3_9PSEU|nr:ABC transporter ATP-binding protein [Prauserella marina]PWV74752.1 ABC transporter family protein [Prauserella marina]SDD41616.1 peptide/nickel transport system ATP-binding protein [Prauserella marina]